VSWNEPARLGSFEAREPLRAEPSRSELEPAREPRAYFPALARRLEASFEGFSIKNILRGENEHADLLAKSAAQGAPSTFGCIF
jgi:hypothetical protein